ncbi:MAG TPA: ArdC-like ssDNA-binding domain-containing protein [Kiritimatiellia bacterium]|nr:ArdC-like ssDNA-binding domain-containing protein [Kiritimatiellia bacterium]
MKKTYQPTEAQIAAAKEKRAALCRATAPFKHIVEANRKAAFAGQAGADPAKIAEILAGVPAKYRGCYTLNACLEVNYREQTGQTEFHTFQAWREKGFAVRKGEHGFMLWSQPKVMQFETGAVDAKGEPEKETVERFALAYVFHAGQVRPIATPAEMIG